MSDPKENRNITESDVTNDSPQPSMGIGMGVVMGAGSEDTSGMMGMMGLMGAMSMMNASGTKGGAAASGGKLLMPDGTPAPTIEPVLPVGFWKCPQCNNVNNGKFCVECGASRPK